MRFPGQQEVGGKAAKAVLLIRGLGGSFSGSFTGSMRDFAVGKMVLLLILRLRA